MFFLVASRLDGDVGASRVIVDWERQVDYQLSRITGRVHVCDLVSRDIARTRFVGSRAVDMALDASELYTTGSEGEVVFELEARDGTRTGYGSMHGQ